MRLSILEEEVRELREAEELLEHCQDAIIDKTRFNVEHDGPNWEIDVFGGENAGLIVAEIELDSEEQSFKHPGWLGAEVTDQERYLKSKLSRDPYSTWANGAASINAGA